MAFFWSTGKPGQVYRYEIDQGYAADRSSGGESGAPACYSGGELSDTPDRRILHAAVVNCRSLGLNLGVRFNIPVAAFAKFFLALPLILSPLEAPLTLSLLTITIQRQNVVFLHASLIWAIHLQRMVGRPGHQRPM